MDVDGDGENELIVTADRIYLLRYQPEKKVPFQRLLTLTPGGPCASTPRILDLPEGKQILIVGSDDDHLYGFSLPDGSLCFRFPTGGDIFSTPWIGDLDGDHENEIIFGSDDGKVYCLKLRENGTLAGVTSFSTGHFVASSPVVLPLPDGRRDLFIGSWDEHLYCLRGKDLAQVWKVPLGHILWSTPALYDLDHDGRMEIVVTNHCLHILREDGTPFLDPPFFLGSFTVASPLARDLDRDGEGEIIALGDAIYLFKSGDLWQIPGTRGIYWSSPLAFDFDGDGMEEVAVCDYSGRFILVSCKGEIVPGFPIPLGSAVVAPLAIADLGRDRIPHLLIADSLGTLHLLSVSDLDFCSRRRNPPNPAPPPTEPYREPLSPVIRRISVKKAGPLKLRELSLEISPFRSLRKGFLYFQKKGRFLPSPLFGDGHRYVARFPPFPRFSRIAFYLVLEFVGGRVIRIPERGTRILFLL